MSPEQSFDHLMVIKRAILLKKRAGIKVWGPNWEAKVDEHIQNTSSFFHSIIIHADPVKIAEFLNDVDRNFVRSVFGSVKGIRRPR